MKISLSKHTREVKLSPRPARGQGLNTWLFATAATLSRCRVPMAEAHAFLVEQAGYDARPGEIERQVEQDYLLAGTRTPQRTPAGRFKIPTPPPPKWPARDDDQIRELVRTTPATAQDVIAASPRQPAQREVSE